MTSEPITNVNYRYVLTAKESRSPHWEDTVVLGVFPNIKEAEDRTRFSFPDASFKECERKAQGKRWYATNYHGTVETGPITVYNIYEVAI